MSASVSLSSFLMCLLTTTMDQKLYLTKWACWICTWRSLTVFKKERLPHSPFYKKQIWPLWQQQFLGQTLGPTPACEKWLDLTLNWLQNSNLPDRTTNATRPKLSTQNKKMLFKIEIRVTETGKKCTSKKSKWNNQHYTPPCPYLCAKSTIRPSFGNSCNSQQRLAFRAPVATWTFINSRICTQTKVTSRM